MIVPALRFKDDDGQEFPEWEEKTLGETVTIRSGISPSSYPLSTFDTYPFLKVEDLNNCFKYQEKSREYSSSNKNLVPKNSIIFPKRGAAILNNKVRVVRAEVLMDSNLMALTPHNGQIHFEFLYYKLFKEQLFKIADTSSIPQINNKHILPYIVYLPSPPNKPKSPISSPQ
jgi:type I restriction enzyme S subunit